MLDSMSYTPTEVFAHDLKSRLQTLDGGASSPPSSDEETVPSRPMDIAHIRTLLLKQQPQDPTLFGTTFPPSKCMLQKVQSHKYHSETDLSMPQDSSQQPETTSSNQTTDTVQTISTIQKEEQVKMTKNKELLDSFHSIQSPDDDPADSDLFFDFDIESPDQDFPDEDVSDKNIDDKKIVVNSKNPTEKLMILCENDDEIRRSSESSLESETMMNLTGPSTAFGSTSSGLYSDTDGKSDYSLLDGGLSIDPDSWLKNPGASLEDMLKLKQQQNEEYSTDDSSKESVVTLEDIQGVQDGDDDNIDKTTIQIGEKEKEIAHSKLTALISLLDKDRDVSNSSRRSSTIGKPNSPPAESLNELLVVPKETPCTSTPSGVSPTTTGTSPANFSFLIQSGSAPEAVTTSEVEGNKNLEDSTKKLTRSHSTSTLTDLTKHIQKQHQQESEKTREINNPFRFPITTPASSTLNQTSSTPTKADHPYGTPCNNKNDEDSKKSKYRRSSSLKSGKTPPGTPGRQKIVRFADVFGLDLADVKTFLDEVPKVPKSAFQDLKDAELSDLDSDSGSDRAFPVQPPSGPPITHQHGGHNSRKTGPYSAVPTFSPLFSQPSGSSDFFNKLRDRKVILENAYMSDLTTVKGIVRVVNLDFHKSVFVRYTLDEWSTTSDTSASYMSGSSDGFSDKFVFNIDVNSIKGIVGRKIQFCICFTCSNNQYWDNNSGKNYIFQCFGGSGGASKSAGVNPLAPPTSIPIPTFGVRPISGQSSSISTLLSQFGASSPSAMLDDPWQRYC